MLFLSFQSTSPYTNREIPRFQNLQHSIDFVSAGFGQQNVHAMLKKGIIVDETDQRGSTSMKLKISTQLAVCYYSQLPAAARATLLYR